MHLFRIVLCYLFAFVSFASANVDVYTLISTQDSHPAPGLTKTVRLYQVGPNPLNRFRIVRVRKTGFPSQRPLLLLSPFDSDSRNYEITPSNRYSETMIGNLALHGYDAWALDDRVNMLPSGACEQPGNDCSIMATWGFETRIADTEFARGVLKQFHPHQDPVLMGEEAGGMIAIAAVNRFPTHYRALYATVAAFTRDPAALAKNAASCAEMQGLLAQGTTYIDQFGSLEPIITAARTAPNAPSTLPGFPPGLTNHQVLVLLLSTPGSLGTIAFSPTYTYAAGDVAQDKFFYLDDQSLYRYYDILGHYVAVPHLRDIVCSYAGDTQYVNNLAAYQRRVLFLGTGIAQAPFLSEVASLFTNARVRVENFGGRGEGDLYFSRDRLRLQDPIVFDWLEDVYR